MAELAPVESVQLIIDTNVMLDIASCHDLSNSTDEDVDSRGSVYRRQRAKDGVTLAMLLERDGLTTFNLWGESAALFHARVNPHEATPETVFTTTFLHFTKDVILPRWNMMSDVNESPDARGDEADRALVKLAVKHGVPLVSNEGFGPDGPTKAKLVGKAEGAGVTLLTPRQYFAGKIDEDEAANDFMLRFLANREEYVRTHPSPDAMRDYFATFLTGYSRHVLFGITNGRDRPVAVRLSPQP